MAKVGYIFKKYHSSIAFWLCLFISIFLMICGFFSIPVGEIHSSVLMATGVLFGFAALGVIPDAIKEGMGFKLKHNETEIEVVGRDSNNSIHPEDC